MVWILTDMGEIDAIKRPKPKNEVKVKPMMVSSFKPENFCRNNIEIAANPPATKAPNENGRPNI